MAESTDSIFDSRGFDIFLEKVKTLNVHFFLHCVCTDRTESKFPLPEYSSQAAKPSVVLLQVLIDAFLNIFLAT